MFLEAMCLSPHPPLQGTRPPPFWRGLPSGAGFTAVPLRCVCFPLPVPPDFLHPVSGSPVERVWVFSRQVDPGRSQTRPPPATPPAPLSLKSEPSHAYGAEPLTQKPVWGEGGGFWLSFRGGIVQHPASPLRAGLVWRLHIQNPWKTLNRSLSGATERPL